MGSSDPGSTAGRRDEFVEPYFWKAKPDQVVAILKAREPARIMMTAIGTANENRWHLQIAQRWVVQYNFYQSAEFCGGAGATSAPALRLGEAGPESPEPLALPSHNRVGLNVKQRLPPVAP